MQKHSTILIEGSNPQEPQPKGWGRPPKAGAQPTNSSTHGNIAAPQRG